MDRRSTPPASVDSTAVTDPVIRRATAVFRAGFRASLALLITGVGLMILRSESLPSQLVPIDAIVTGVIEGTSASFVTLGILTMILTPVISTVAICVTFAQQGDPRYARFTATVLLILVLSISLSLR